jgi:hypothetical protein
MRKHKYEEEKKELNSFLQFPMTKKLDFRQETRLDKILVLT